MNVWLVLLPFVGAVAGTVVTPMLQHRNERRAHADRLLVDALNEAIGGIALLAQAGSAPPSAEALSKYAAGAARIALYGNPVIVRALLDLRDHPNTGSPEGRSALVALLQSARKELHRGDVDDKSLAIAAIGLDRDSRSVAS